jgi:hypothetical protein
MVKKPATRATGTKAAKTSATSKSKTRRKKPTATTAAAARVRIRMYRLGVGDCFLVSFPRVGKEDYRILIDCGVHQAQKGGNDRLKEVARDLLAVTKGKIDVVVGTHEHQDHLSGFPGLLDLFKKEAAGEIWVAWTEDDNDAFAKSLRAKKDKALAALSGARMRMTLAGASGEEAKLTSLLGFFGDGSGPKLKSFGNALKALSATIKYHTPGEPPIELLDGQARVFVLGPPRDKKLLGRSAPSTADDGQVYKFGAYAALLDQLEPALGSEPTGPFDDRFALPLDGTRAVAFFKRHYWADTNDENLQDRIDNTQDWRRIDTDWMTSATTLALQLDEDTNNTSLVLAFELGPKDRDGPVLLFAADAQVGNWLSWQGLKWEYAGRTITGPDLLKRTAIYKVGHHASHNATLKKLGLELMTSLELALIPTDAEMAKTVKWGTLPWPPLLDALDVQARHGAIRTDKPLGKKSAGAKVTENQLYYEIEF